MLKLKKCCLGESKDICTPIFTAVLFTVAKKCKQPKCLTDE